MIKFTVGSKNIKIGGEWYSVGYGVVFITLHALSLFGVWGTKYNTLILFLNVFIGLSSLLIASEIISAGIRKETRLMRADRKRWNEQDED